MEAIGKNIFLMGLDLGQQNDYTVLSLLRMKVTQNEMPSYSLIFLHKFQLKTSYPDIVSWVLTFIAYGFSNNNSKLIIDYTGVGRPVVDLFMAENINLIAINITGGLQHKWKSSKEASVPKKDIISSLQVVLQNKRLKIASNLPFLDDLKKEFLNFKYKLSAAGNSQFSAASSYHDDIVLSLGMATWYGEVSRRKGNRLRIISGS